MSLVVMDVVELLLLLQMTVVTISTVVVVHLAALGKSQLFMAVEVDGRMVK